MEQRRPLIDSRYAFDDKDMVIALQELGAQNIGGGNKCVVSKMPIKNGKQKNI